MLDTFGAGTFQELARIHGYLFSGIYAFAGKIRTVNIAKGSFRFAPALLAMERSPIRDVEIYYLVDGKYILEESYMLQEDPEDEDYNAETEISLRAFPQIKMTLNEIFEGLD